MMFSFYNPKTDKKFYVQRNVGITKETTAINYWKKVKNILEVFWDTGSITDVENYTFIIV